MVIYIHNFRISKSRVSFWKKAHMVSQLGPIGTKFATMFKPLEDTRQEAKPCAIAMFWVNIKQKLCNHRVEWKLPFQPCQSLHSQGPANSGRTYYPTPTLLPAPFALSFLWKWSSRKAANYVKFFTYQPISFNISALALASRFPVNILRT